MAKSILANQYHVASLKRHSAVNVQGLASFDRRKLSRRMGTLSASSMDRVKQALRDLLGL